MRSWAPSFRFPEVGRQQFIRVGLAVVLIGGLVWALPVRRAGEDGGHHGGHAPVELDAFERAGVIELHCSTSEFCCIWYTLAGIVTSHRWRVSRVAL